MGRGAQIEDVVGGLVDMISLVERLLNNDELQAFVEVRKHVFVVRRCTWLCV
jgi:hypothetical protein